MVRVDGWPDLLIAEIEHHNTLPFQYGVSCCVTFPLACVRAVTGIWHWEEDHGPNTKIGAAKLMLSKGFSDVGEVFAYLFPEIHPVYAMRGDVGVIDGEEGPIGVVMMNSAIGKRRDGVGNMQIPRELVKRAFRV